MPSNRIRFAAVLRKAPRIASAACLILFCAAAQDANFDPTGWLSDYAALKQALEKRYSNLAWFGSPEGGVDLPALDRQTLAALKSAQSEEQARNALLNFVTSFHDGHFSQLRDPARPADAKPAEPVYSRSDARSGCSALGYAVDRSPSFSLPFERLPGFQSLSDGMAQPFRAGILLPGDSPVRLGIVRIPSFRATAESLCLAAWNRDDAWDKDGKLIVPAVRQAAEQGWYDALAGLLRTFKSEGAAAVLVDIGDNSGGNDSGDIAARLFTALPLHSASLWMSQDESASAAYFDEQMQALRRALQLDPGNSEVQKSLATFTRQKEKLAQDICPMDWVWRERRGWNSGACRRLVEAGSAGGPLAYLAPGAVADREVARRLHWPAQITPLWNTWTGPLYVLTNGRTYSAAEMFAAVLQNNRAAKIVGAPTGGDGCGFMIAPDPLVLPVSQLRFRIPNCVRMRADGTDEVAGIKPDLPVLPSEGEDDRALALRLLHQLRGDLKQTEVHRGDNE